MLHQSATRLLLWGALCFISASAALAPPTPLKLWYKQPAANRNEALPIGNGRLGAMVFGGPAQERLQLNEATIWGGGPNNNVKPDALPVIRQLLLSGQEVEAQALAELFVQRYDGAIDILPALPDAWPTGEVQGLMAWGGYVMDVAWDQSKMTKVQVTSRLGGNCRVRVHGPVKASGGTRLAAARGDNPNPFYQMLPVKAPLISPKAAARKPTLPPSFVYDIATQAGKTYTLQAQ